jgi:hypothetical protein
MRSSSLAVLFIGRRLLPILQFINLMGTKYKGDQLNNYDQSKSDLYLRFLEADEIIACFIKQVVISSLCVESGMAYVL